MPFDANLVLADTTADWTYANLVTPQTYGTPTSIVKNSGGFVVIDLLAISTTAAQGMSAVFICGNSVTTADELTLVLESSDDVDFASDSSNDVQRLAQFDILGKASGIIEGDECPCTVVRRFSTIQRYIRAKATVSSGDDYGACWVLLAPWPFHTL